MGIRQFANKIVFQSTPAHSSGRYPWGTLLLSVAL